MQSKVNIVKAAAILTVKAAGNAEKPNKYTQAAISNNTNKFLGLLIKSLMWKLAIKDLIPVQVATPVLRILLHDLPNGFVVLKRSTNMIAAAIATLISEL